MSNSSYEVKRVLFDIEPELTQVYVAITAYGDSPIGVQGWHHKTFPASKSMLDIMNGVADGSIENWVMWPLNAPPRSRLDGGRDSEASI